MKPELNGTLASRPWVILATDRIHLGKPIRALTKDGNHLTCEFPGHSFARFATAEEARRWLDAIRPSLTNYGYTYTIDVI